jgi:hypothetical protein
MNVACACHPNVDWKNSVAVHSSFDGREAVEMAEEIIKVERPPNRPNEKHNHLRRA